MRTVLLAGGRVNVFYGDINVIYVKQGRLSELLPVIGIVLAES